VVRKNSVRRACPWRITHSTFYEAGGLQATIEAGFKTVQSLGAAIDKDVRDATNAGAIPGPCLLTSIHQITEKSGAPAELPACVLRPQSQAETTARTVTPSRSIPSSSEVCVFGRENLTASYVGCQDTSRKDLVVRDGHDILRENYKISELAGLD
jgi:hypothetical protein